MAVWFFFVCFVFIPNLLNQKVHADPAVDDRDALLAFKAAFYIESDYLECLKSWDETNDDACLWFHVTCDNTENRRVTRIDLGGCSLIGSLVPELGLTYIELQDNKLNGTVPEELAKNFPPMCIVNLTANNGCVGGPGVLTGDCTKEACVSSDPNCLVN